MSKTELKDVNRILAIETSCDETAAAVIESGRMVLSSVVASQADLHSEYGGVFPEVASRQHIRSIHSVVDQVLKEAHISLDGLDGIAVTRGPGLPGSLVVGVNMAKGLSLGSRLPIIGINHLEAHIYSAWIQQEGKESEYHEPIFPLMILLVSGGHSELILMLDHLKYERLGGTLDDAAGEAFDKVARLIGLSYPGGPAIQKAAENGNSEAYSFPRALLEGTWNFSFSGLKTAVLREVRPLSKVSLDTLPVSDLAASFQTAVVDVLVTKTLKAAHHYKVKEILIAGGVSANKELRETFMQKSAIPVNIPPLFLCTDNAAMVGAAGFFRMKGGYRDSLNMDVLPTWSLTELG